MTVQQKDEIIAKYMGFYTMGSIRSWSAPASIFHIYGNSWFTADQLKFNSSIEWLYPVARKVKQQLSTAYPELGGLGTLVNSQILISKLNQAASEFTIESLYPIVVEAIEFLNKNKEV